MHPKALNTTHRQDAGALNWSTSIDYLRLIEEGHHITIASTPFSFSTLPTNYNVAPEGERSMCFSLLQSHHGFTRMPFSSDTPLSNPAMLRTPRSYRPHSMVHHPTQNGSHRWRNRRRENRCRTRSTSHTRCLSPPNHLHSPQISPRAAYTEPWSNL